MGIILSSPATLKDSELRIKDSFPQFESHELRVGSQVRWAQNMNESNLSSFTRQTLESREQIEEWLGSDDLLAKQKRAYLVSKGFNYPFDIDKLVPVQFMTDVGIKGTSYNVLSITIETNETRIAKSGDVMWVFWDATTRSIKPHLSIRADCGNGGFVSIHPYRNFPTNLKSVSDPYTPIGDSFSPVTPIPNVRNLGTLNSARSVSEPKLGVFYFASLVCFWLKCAKKKCD